MTAELPPKFNERSRDMQWVVGGYEFGDIVIHDIRTVHASSPPPAGMKRVGLELRVVNVPMRKGMSTFRYGPLRNIKEKGVSVASIYPPPPVEKRGRKYYPGYAPPAAITIISRIIMIVI